MDKTVRRGMTNDGRGERGIKQKKRKEKNSKEVETGGNDDFLE